MKVAKNGRVMECQKWCKRTPRHFGPCLRFTIEDVEAQPAGFGGESLFERGWVQGATDMLEMLNEAKLPSVEELRSRRWVETTIVLDETLLTDDDFDKLSRSVGERTELQYRH